MERIRIGIVMAGGSGERFWPLSRPDRPKQLLRLTDPAHTMLEEAVERARPIFGDQVFVATSESLKAPVLASGIVPANRVLSEPTRRNTLGAQCWVVAHLIAEGHDDATVAILTSDHLIGGPEQFRNGVLQALEAAEECGGIVTIGIPPTRPETGYGYIEEGESIDGCGTSRSVSFREKPSPATAEEFVASGRFLWNSGMFFYTVPEFLKTLETTQPLAYEATLATAEALRQGDDRAAAVAFEALPNVSIDYAVMERTSNISVVRGGFQWDDMGAWDAMERAFPTDENGNVIHGDAVVIESHGCVVVNEHRTAVVGAVGVRDLVVVMAENAVLVCPKEQAQKVRLIAQALSARTKS